MKKLPDAHPYQDRTALNRLLLIIAVFIRQPGIGYPEETNLSLTGEHHNALAVVATGLEQLSIDLGREIAASSVPTLRKDLEFLRKYGIIEERMYRWGYYLGTGIFSHQELQVAVQALKDIGDRLGDPSVRDLYQKLEKRLRGLELGERDLYPVRSQLDRSIVHTNPDRMREQKLYRETLFDRLSEVETAIVTGQGIEIYYARAPYQTGTTQHLQVYPLQLIYHDVAWYLICDLIDSKYLAAIRLDRLSSHLCQLTHLPPRGKSAQLDRLKIVNRLLQNGWGLSLGSQEQQLQELNGDEGIEVKVRFFEKVAPFIQEGEKRHPRQKIVVKKNLNGKLEFITYSTVLPERSLPEFFRWVRRFGSQALVLSPEKYVEEFRQELRLLADLYLN
ncbi:helix-turn-helix transcriptional regulator [Chamaesiphon sp.]|uniref:helix-turn-helix transcriptional regulator n=1 Tax=Chamaesiphon sp. TaxID=2814140 RepID=UPI003594541A